MSDRDARDTTGEVVVLLDDAGRAVGTLAKAEAHHADTPLHLAFSCYVFDTEDRLLVTQRALGKSVFPGVWTNSLCGHPAPGESAQAAAQRRAREELGLDLPLPRLVLPGFAYRAVMDGVVENERCPVLVAHVSHETCTPNSAEVEATAWVPWADFAREVLAGTRTVSPWCVEQVQALMALGATPRSWPTGDPTLLPPALRDLP